MPRRATPIYRRGAGGGSFFDSPIVLYDMELAYVGAVPLQKELRIGTGSSRLQSQDALGALVDIVTMPIQYHEVQPGALIEPPEGAGHWWYIRYINPQGPDPLTDDSTGVDNWAIINTTYLWALNRPAAGTVENTLTFQIASFLTAGPTFVRMYAQADVILRYTRA